VCNTTSSTNTVLRAFVEMYTFIKYYMIIIVASVSVSLIN